MKKPLSILASLAAALIFFGGCSTAPKTDTARANLNDEARTALNKFERKDSSLQDLLARSAGYAIFPTVGKGGLGVGGAYGKGALYQNGQEVGYCDLSQASIGFQAGGEEYSELIVFKDQEALNKFKNGNYAFSAEASAVALKPGAAAQTEFKQGVAVFAMTNAGLMAEASLAGQKFRFTPASDTDRR